MKPEQLGTSGPKEVHSSNLPGYSFCITHSKLGAEETGNPETPTHRKKISRQLSLFYLIKELGKRQPSKAEKFQTIPP